MSTDGNGYSKEFTEQCLCCSVVLGLPFPCLTSDASI